MTREEFAKLNPGDTVFVTSNPVRNHNFADPARMIRKETVSDVRRGSYAWYWNGEAVMTGGDGPRYGSARMVDQCFLTMGEAAAEALRRIDLAQEELRVLRTDIESMKEIV